MACEYGHANVLAVFIKHKANTSGVLDTKTNDGSSLLHLVVLNGQYKCVKTLLDNGLNMNEKRQNGNTPLHDACVKGNIRCIKMLIEVETETIDIQMRPVS